MTRPDPTRPGPARPDPARPGPARPDPTRHNPTRPDSVRWDIRCAAHLPPQLEHRLYYNARGFLWPPARPPARSHRRPPTFYIFKTPNGVMCPSSIFNVRCDARSTCPKIIQSRPMCPSSSLSIQWDARSTCPEVRNQGWVLAATGAHSPAPPKIHKPKKARSAGRYVTHYVQRLL